MSGEATADLFPSGIGVKCAQCGWPFTATVLYEPAPDGGELVRFGCPRCGRRYEAATVTARGVALREQLQRALAGCRRTGRPEHQQRVERLQRALRREVRRSER